MDKTLAVYVKIVNEIEDLFEYRYKKMNKEEIRKLVFDIIDNQMEKLKVNK